MIHKISLFPSWSWGLLRQCKHEFVKEKVLKTIRKITLFITSHHIVYSYFFPKKVIPFSIQTQELWHEWCIHDEESISLSHLLFCFHVTSNELHLFSIKRQTLELFSHFFSLTLIIFMSILFRFLVVVINIFLLFMITTLKRWSLSWLNHLHQHHSRQVEVVWTLLLLMHHVSQHHMSKRDWNLKRKNGMEKNKKRENTWNPNIMIEENVVCIRNDNLKIERGWINPGFEMKSCWKSSLENEFEFNHSFRVFQLKMISIKHKLMIALNESYSWWWHEVKSLLNYFSPSNILLSFPSWWSSWAALASWILTSILFSSLVLQSTS